MKTLLSKIKRYLGFLDITRSFAAKMSFYVILMAGLLFVASSVFVSYYSRSLIKDEAIRNAFNQLKSVNLEIENVLQGVSVAVDNMEDEIRRAVMKGPANKDEVYRLSRLLVEKNVNIIGCDIALEPYYYPSQKYFAAFSLRTGDTIVTSQVGSDSYDYPSLDWYQIPKLLGHPYWTDPFFDSGGANVTMCTYSRPIYDDNHNFLGVINADLPLEWMTEMVSAIKPYANSYNIMIGKGAAYIVHPNTDLIKNETIFTAAVEYSDSTIYTMGQSMIHGETGMVEIDHNDVLSYYFYAPVPSVGWSLAIVCPHKDVYAGVIKMNRSMVLVVIIGLLLLFLCVKNVIGRLARPLSVFSTSAIRIADGDFNSPLPEINTQDELRRLRDSFQYMQTSLTSFIEELKATTSAKERIESELSIARNIQMGMIPKIFPAFPERTDIDLYAMLRPAKEVGGDLYDFFISNEKLYAVIGDVSGKGVPASLLMAVTRSLFRSVASNLNDSKEIISSLNSSISETNESNMFVTMFVMILDLPTGNMQFCNAGHNPPVILASEGHPTFLEMHPNIPIGLFNGFEYDNQTIHIDRGTTLFLYTDGLTEAENCDKVLYAEQHLLDVLEGENKTPAKELIGKVSDSVDAHVNHYQQSDDLTMVAIRY